MPSSSPRPPGGGEVVGGKMYAYLGEARVEYRPAGEKTNKKTKKQHENETFSTPVGGLLLLAVLAPSWYRFAPHPLRG